MTKERYEVGDTFIPATAVRVLKRWEVGGINWYEIERLDGEAFEDSDDDVRRSEFTRSVSESELDAMHETPSAARIERLEEAVRALAGCLSVLQHKSAERVIDLLDMEDA